MIRLIIIALMSLLFYSGCGGGGSSPLIMGDDDHIEEFPKNNIEEGSGSLSNGVKDNPKKDIQDDKKDEDQKVSEDKKENQKPSNESDNKAQEKKVRSVYSFVIHTTKGTDENELDASVGINNFHLTIQRGSKIIFDTSSDNSDISAIMNQDNSILIRSNEALQKGDIISLNADGFTPQQQKINDVALEGNSLRVALKPIGSRQVFELGALNSGRITTRATMGASTKLKGDNIEFKTDDNSIVLNIKKSQIDRMAKRVRRLPKADKNTEIYLDITTIDPKTEMESAIGDLTYNSSKEPRASRFTKSATTSNETMLESVVMTSISMTTSEGDEIHCFDGSSYDEESGECSGDSTATLKMKIPSSQFDKYADKYNKGDRTVPMYHYSKAQSTWVRQVKDGKSIDGELVLEDMNSNDIADEGDTLYISSSVTHFSYWNGDYPVDVQYLKGHVEVKNGGKLPIGTVVVSKGSDYIGRSFRELISSDLTYAHLGAKANSKVELYLEYPDGTKSDSIFIQTGKTSEVENVDEVLICDYQMQEVTLSVVDQDDKPLSGAIVRSMGTSLSTDNKGEVKISLLKDKNTKVTASYDTGEFVSSSTKFINSDDTKIIVDTKSFKISGKISFVDENGKAMKFRDGFVRIYDDNYDLYQIIYLKNDSFSLLLPLSKFHDGKNIHINAGIFVPLYGKFIEQDRSVTINSTDMKKFQKNYDFAFKLKPFIVSGKVTNPFASGDKKGLPNITIYSESQSVQSDEDGNYRMLLFYKEGGQKLRAYDSINNDIARPNEINIAQDEQDEDHSGKDFIIDKRVAKIEGVVINSKGIPISELPIYTNIGWLSTVTDEDGKFSFEINTPWLMGRSDVVVHVYDANDNSKLLGSIKVDDEIAKGKTIDVGEITISTNIAPIIRSVTWDNPILDQEMNIYVDAYDPDNDEIQTTISLSDGSIVTIEQGVGVITPKSVGNLEFQINVSEVSSAEKLTVSKIARMIVSQDAKPKIKAIDGFEKNFDKQIDMNITVSAEDPEGGSLSFDAKLFDMNGDEVDKLVVSNNNFKISKDIVNGRYHLIIYISDGVNQIERNLKFRANDNSVPKDLRVLKDGKEVGNILYIKSSDAQLELIADAKDDDGDELSYSWNFNKYLGEESGNRLVINPSGKVGIFPITISVTDSKAYISKDITLVIANNLKPIIRDIKLNPQTITKIGDKLFDNQGNEVTSLNVDINATDPEGTLLTYKFGEIKSAFSPTSDFAQSNTKTYDISKLGVGRYAFKVDVKDGDSKIKSKRVLFKILENKPPRINSFFVPIKAKNNTIIKLKASAIDPEGDDISYKWSASNGGNSLNIDNSENSDAQLNLIENISGEINIKLEVKDAKNNIVTRKRVIKIVENRAPVINKFRVLPTSVKVGKGIQFSVLASDPDFDEISYKWYWNGELISEDKRGSLEISADMQEGIYDLKLVVSDGKLSSQQIEKISVEAVDATPVVTISASKTQILVGSQLEISANVNVPSRLKWKVSEGGQIVAKTGGAIFSSDKEGLYDISVLATNKDGVDSELATIKIDVRSVDLRFLIQNPIQIIGNEFRIDAQLSDDSFTIPLDALWKISQKPDASVASLSVDGSSATITPDKSGTYKITLSFEIDGVNFSEEQIIQATKDSSLDEAHSIHGVVSGDNGEILEGAKVRLYNADDSSLYDQTITTDNSGSYIFEDLLAGRYYLVVSGGDGYINQSEVIVIN